MSMLDDGPTASRWDDEYRRGRYVGEPPLPFVSRISTVLKARPHLYEADGLYIGCGNGRNYLPLIDSGLRLYGLDVSEEALNGLTRKRPDVTARVVHMDFRRFHSDRRFGYVVAIQVFQHGDGTAVRAYFERVTELLGPGGLLFLRVNSVSTQIYHAHTVVEHTEAGGLTIRYDEGPKRGLLVHFYSQRELERLADGVFTPIDEPREDIIWRSPPKRGFWAQWEMIWERR